MAMFHSHAQVVGRTDGRSATGAAAYRAGVSIADQRTGLVFDYERRRGVAHSEITLPADAPEWMLDRVELWNSVEAMERRKDAQVAREWELALPVELPDEDKIALARRWVGELVDLGMAVDWNCHDFDGPKRHNPHFHALATMRPMVGGEWGPKAREWNDRSLIEDLRARFAEMTNESLAAWAAKESIRPEEVPRVDHRSLAAQGIARKPQQRIKPSIMGMAKRGIEWATAFVAERRIAPPKPTPDKEPTHEPAQPTDTYDFLAALTDFQHAVQARVNHWLPWTAESPRPGGSPGLGLDAPGFWGIGSPGLRELGAGSPSAGLAGAGGAPGGQEPDAEGTRVRRDPTEGPGRVVAGFRAGPQPIRSLRLSAAGVVSTDSGRADAQPVEAVAPAAPSPQPSGPEAVVERPVDAGRNVAHVRTPPSRPSAIPDPHPKSGGSRGRG
jgi:hypothetical protein